MFIINSYAYTTPSGGALAVNRLTQGSDTSANPSTTSSISPTSGSVRYLWLAVAQTAAPAAIGSFGISGGTWTLVASRQDSGFRRAIFLYRSTDATGVQTITYTPADGTWTETAWILDEWTGCNMGTPNDAAVTAGSSSGTSGAIASVGTAGAGDRVYAGWWHETSEAVTATGFTATGSGVTGLTDVRTLHAFYDASDPQDDTPVASWATSSQWGGIGLIVNKA